MVTHRFLVRWTPALALLGALALAADARAGERRFGYSYEPKVLPAGAVEFEPWWTHRIGTAAGVANRWDLRTEFEFGLTDTVLTAFYLNLRGVHLDGARSGHDAPRVTGDTTEVKGISNEWIWKLADASADPLGVALYGEWTWDGAEFELEFKGLLGKQLGPVSFVYNFIVELEWEFEHDAAESRLEIEREALLLANTLGISVPLVGALRVGFEARHESRFARWTAPDWSTVFAGPTLHVAADGWWLTCTVLAQCGAAQPTAHGRELADNAQVEVRLLIGMDLPGNRRATAAPGASE